MIPSDDLWMEIAQAWLRWDVCYSFASRRGFSQCWSRCEVIQIANYRSLFFIKSALTDNLLLSYDDVNWVAKSFAGNIFGSSCTKNKKKILKLNLAWIHDAARLSASLMATRFGRDGLLWNMRAMSLRPLIHDICLPSSCVKMFSDSLCYNYHLIKMYFWRILSFYRIQNLMCDC